MKFNIKTFKELFYLHEAVKEKQFKINIDSVEYTVIRDSHLLQKRNGDVKPKDFRMSKTKYAQVLSHIDKVDTSKSFSFTWYENGKSNIISAELKGNNIKIFGAIMNSSKDAKDLYPRVTNRYHII